MMKSTESVKRPGKLRGWFFAASLCGLAVVLTSPAVGFAEPGGEQVPEGKGDMGAPFADLIRELRKEKKLVGLAAMVAVDGEVVASAVDGERKKGTGVRLEISDRWHLGSITKSITATMVARLVESGRMQWPDSIGQCFPDATIHDGWKPVTLKELLTHTAGAPANFSFLVALQQPAPGPECTRARREAVLKVLAKEPAHPPGEKHVYSNVGYTIAAAMAEKATGATWEDLVKREVFEPLELTGAGFGPPKSTDDALEQPRGHSVLFAWKVPVNDEADNSPIIGPAGSVHMTLSDLCTYATEHLRGERGAGKLLSAEAYKLLHAPKLEGYACGWVKMESGEGFAHTVYWHNGSNALWYALVAFIPERNMVIAVTSNDGDYVKAEAAAWEIVKDRADYPKKSPFAGVRWQEFRPEVKLGEEWFELVSLDEVPASEIVAFSRRTYGDKWRKRFEEDLVELLTRMGHPPQDKVTLVVQSLTSPEMRTLEGVAMTEANRRAIKAAASGNGRDEGR